MRRGAVFLAIFLIVIGCGANPTVVPTRNLDRPSDLAFTCLAVDDSGVVSGRPMYLCHPPGRAERPFDEDMPRTFGSFGLVTNTSRGEVGVIDLQRHRLLDLDPRQPGYNMLPVGELPEVIASTQDGCKAVTVNRGSCDLTLIDSARLLQGAFGGATPSSGQDAPVARRIVPRTRSGRRLQVAPQELVMLPQFPLSHLEGDKNLCTEGSAIQPGGTPGPWQALVTFPACDLVAMVNLPSGEITSAMYLRPEGLVDAGPEPVCPIECGAGMAAVADGGASSALRVGALAVLPDRSRAYVGALGASFIAAVEITAGGLALPAEGARIPLHEGAMGVSRLRLSVNPFLPEDPKKEFGAQPQGRFVGAQQFLYAFARDGSVRVVAVKQLNRPDYECDVNTVPVPGSNIACFSVDEMNPRRPLAEGPGLRIPTANSDLPAPIPRDIAFGTVTSASSEGLDGSFGYLLGSDGQVYIINVAPSTRQGDNRRPNSFRNGNAANGAPRLVGPPARSFTGAGVPFPTRVMLVGALAGPRIEPVPAPDTALDTLPRFVVFTDPGLSFPQPWSIIWEDVLPGTNRTTGAVKPGALEDIGADFCRAGVRPGDVLLLPGCTQTADCLKDRVCRSGAPGAPGLCLPKAQASDEAILRACTRAMTSRRRYEVTGSGRSQLTLGLKLDELPRTALDACQSDQDCEAPPTFVGFKCQSIRDGEPPRCVKPCEKTGDDRACRIGFVCENFPASASTVLPLCVEGPTIDQVCWPDLARYRVQAGKSFVVKGGVMPRFPTLREVNGMCVPDERRNPLLQDRIPLNAAACADLPDESTIQAAHGKLFEGPGARVNPCLYRARNIEDPEGVPLHVKALFQNPEVGFVVTNLEQFAGDSAAIGFEVNGQSGGFIPEAAAFPSDILLTLSVRIVIGPTRTPESQLDVETGSSNGFPYFYVVDQGRTLSTPSARGQVVRLNPRRGSTGVPRFDSNGTKDAFHIQ